jgi:hypothetical protein
MGKCKQSSPGLGVLLMKRATLLLATIAVGGWLCLSERATRAQIDWASDSSVEGVEELTRGPVHEAFAEPITGEEERFVVPKPPPELIDEEPAELRPEGDNVIWIPGYWAWDPDREDFLWVSGVWRQAPPNQRWTPGYWIEAEGGWVWVSGFWAPIEAEELRYYPPPPESLEVGPSSPSPGEDYFWVTGSWIYRDEDFRWQAGHWAQLQPDWVWVPSRWVWTPAGYVFLPGCWDYPWVRRGCLYTPVYFAANVYRRPGFVYRPRLSINLSSTLVHLWVRPNYRHYYFGDYYASRYRDLGFTPWVTFATGRRHYDPLLTYYQTRYRRDGIDYADRMRSWHEHYVRRENDRPPITWRDQAAWAQKQNLRLSDLTDPRVSTSLVALPARVQAEALRRTDSAIRFTELSRSERERATQIAHSFRTVHNDRADFERQSRSQNLARADRRPDRDGDNRRDPNAVRPDVRWKLPEAAIKAPHVVGKEPTRDLPDGRGRDRGRNDNARSPDRTPRGPGDLNRGERPGAGPDVGRLPGDLRLDERRATTPNPRRDDIPDPRRTDRRDDRPRTTPDRRSEDPLRNLPGRRDDEQRIQPVPRPDVTPRNQPGSERRPDITPPRITPDRRPDTTPDRRSQDPLRNLPDRQKNEEQRIQPVPRTAITPRNSDRRPTDVIPQQLRKPEVRPETSRNLPDLTPRSLPEARRAPEARPDRRPETARPMPDLRRPEVRHEPRRPEVRPEPRVERNRPDPGSKNNDRGPPNKGNDKKQKKDKRD